MSVTKVIEGDGSIINQGAADFGALRWPHLGIVPRFRNVGAMSGPSTGHVIRSEAAFLLMKQDSHTPGFVSRNRHVCVDAERTLVCPRRVAQVGGSDA